jgi:hypothetical protein
MRLAATGIDGQSFRLPVDVLYWVDTVEKVRNKPPARNNRINETDLLNQSSAFDAGLD